MQQAMVPNKMLMDSLSSVYYNAEHGEPIATNPSAIQIMEISAHSRYGKFLPSPLDQW